MTTKSLKPRTKAEVVRDPDGHPVLPDNVKRKRQPAPTDREVKAVLDEILDVKPANLKPRGAWPVAEPPQWRLVRDAVGGEPAVDMPLGEAWIVVHAKTADHPPEARTGGYNLLGIFAALEWARDRFKLMHPHWAPEKPAP